VKFSNIAMSYWKNLLQGIHNEWVKVVGKAQKRNRSFSMEETSRVNNFSYLYERHNQANSCIQTEESIVKVL